MTNDGVFYFNLGGGPWSMGRPQRHRATQGPARRLHTYISFACFKDYFGVATNKTTGEEIGISRQHMTRRSHAGTDPAASRPWEEEVPALLQPVRHRDAGLFSWPSVSRALVMLLTLTVALQIMLLLRSHPTPEPQHKPCSARGDGFSGHAAAHSHAASTPPQPDADVDDFQQGSVDSLYPEPKPWAKRMAGHPSAAWAVAGETEKSGAGLLFFAYGGKQLGHFLDEAQTAARSFRRLNPKIRIALVSNTRRPLDNRTWDVQIRPRPDLLFAGGLNNGDWGDSLPRQWLTRLYYLAHSPFKITWALDSNVYACTPGSAQAFLDDALRRELWGYDIATANQRDGPMYPPSLEPRAQPCQAQPCYAQPC